MEKAAKNNAASRAGAGRTCVLVLGMHRSGTSALARVLNLLGCDLPKTLMEAHSSNETGHWESVEIMNLNNEILGSAGSNWQDWLEFNQGWYVSPKAEEYKERALEILKSEFGKSRLFVLKDPRICRFVPFWLDVLETAGVKPVIIRQVRNPLEVAESLSKRSGLDPALGHLIWLNHVLEAEAGSRGRQRFQASYDRLLNDWPRLITEMQDALHLRWPRLSTLINDDIDKFLSGNLRHHKEPTEAVTGNPFLSAWLRDTFSIFTRWAETGENSDDYAELNRIKVELNSAAPAFARLILAGKQRANELQAARLQVEEQQERLDSLNEERRKLEEAEAKLGSELSTLRTDSESIQREIEDYRGKLAQRNSELDAVQEALLQRNAELDGIKGELTQTLGTLTQRTAEADAANAQLHEARNRVEAIKAELSQTQSALAQRSAEADEVTAQLQAATASLVEAETAHQREVEHSQNLATELETARLQAKAESDRLLKEKLAVERRLADRFGEIATLTRMLGDTEKQLTKKTGKLTARESELVAKKRELKENEIALLASEEQMAILREVSALLVNGSASRSLSGKLAALLPRSTRLKKQQAQLKQKGIFDPDAYLSANPDVAEAGHDPLWHYVNFGIAEKRPLGPNQKKMRPEGSK